MSAAGCNPEIVFTGGGTGGHLFPGLAVARQLLETVPRLRITFAGCGKPLETEQVAQAGLEYLPLRCAPWPRRLRDVGRFFVDNLIGYRTAMRFLAEHPVSAVVGLGGYTSGPMARAAIRQGIPLVLLEQNLAAGRVNRWLARRAAVVCTSFAQTIEYLPSSCRVHHTGNPIRKGFLPAGSQTRQLTILGGSSGARSLNEQVPRALAQVRRSLTGWQIVHQTGPAGFQATQDLYHSLGVEATVVPFVANMPRLLNSTALAICRAGGTTLAELAAAAVPAILIPYPHAANNHQRLNADPFAAEGAAVVLDPRELPSGLESPLAAMLAEVLNAPLRREEMSQAMWRLSKPKATETVADVVASLAGLPELKRLDHSALGLKEAASAA